MKNENSLLFFRELKILKDLKQRLEIRTNTIHDDGFHAQYIWAIESLEKHLKIVNNEIPNEYHPEVSKSL